MKRLALLALVLSAAPAHAQASKVLSCDRLSALLNSPTVYGVWRPSIVKACPAFEKGVANFLAANLDSLRKMTGEQAIQWMLHGPAIAKDTVVTPPVIIVPVDSTPKPIDTTTVPAGALVNAHPMGPLTQPFVTVPKGWVGRSTIDIKQGGGCAGTACTTGEGADRFLCALAKFAFDDPIVFPGQPGVSHLHQFFGNTGVNAFTTSDSIATTGNSTCSGGTANRTGYWTPAAVDSSGQIVPPTVATIYYKSGYQYDPKAITPMPNGLKMIAGDKNWSNAKQNQEHVWWTCTDNGPAFSATIPDCGDRVELIVIFPQCWDGVNLDSPDHKSHMSYPIYSNNVNGSKCPATHPIPVPEVTELFFWAVPKGVRSSTWHLSSDMDVSKPGGLSAHADWEMGWDPSIMATFVTNCLVASKDCQVNGLGDNRYLNPPPL